MHELRKDPLLGRWVAVLSYSLSPSEYQVPVEDSLDAGCILCPGREGETLKEIASFREGEKWYVRVLPHPKPVFQIEGDLGRRGYGMYDKMNNISANEAASNGVRVFMFFKLPLRRGQKVFKGGIIW